MKGFIEFARKQGVIKLAIGFIIATATVVMINALVNDLVSPIIGAVVGQASLDTLTFKIGDAVFAYGHFITVFINFIAILAVVYILFKVLRLEKLDIEEEEEEEK